MYARAIRPDSLSVVEKFIFIEEFIDTVKDQFLRDFRRNG